MEERADLCRKSFGEGREKGLGTAKKTAGVDPIGDSDRVGWREDRLYQ